MTVRPVKTGVYKESDDLVAFIKRYIAELREGSILVVTSKIVALSEGRTAPKRDKKRLTMEESEWTLPTQYGNVALKDGLLMWNAGIDASNADGALVLLPTDSYRAAAELRRALVRLYKVKRLGVLISDSRIMPLRAGVVGVALGYAGFKGLRDYRGRKDIFGRTLRYTRTNVADSLATAAVVEMGEGSERRPLCIIEDAPVTFTPRTNRRELIVPFEKDMYRPLWKAPKKRRK